MLSSLETTHPSPNADRFASSNALVDDQFVITGLVLEVGEVALGDLLLLALLLFLLGGLLGLGGCAAVGGFLARLWLADLLVLGAAFVEIEVDVRPEVTLPALESLTVEIEAAEVDDAAVDAELDKLRAEGLVSDEEHERARRASE